MTTLQSLVPQAKLTLDSSSQSLIAVAVAEDQKTIRGVLEQLQTEKPVPDAPQLRFYPLAEKPSTSTLSLLQSLAPRAKVTLDPSGKQLNVVASPADHNTLRAAIEQIEKGTTAEEKPRLVRYTITPAERKRFESVATTLTAEFPGMQVLPASEPGELSIWATPTQHVALAQIIEQLKHEAPAGEKGHLVAYQIKSAEPASVLKVMQTLFPNTQFTLDAPRGASSCGRPRRNTPRSRRRWKSSTRPYRPSCRTSSTCTRFRT